MDGHLTRNVSTNGVIRLSATSIGLGRRHDGANADVFWQGDASPSWSTTPSTPALHSNAAYATSGAPTCLRCAEIDCVKCAGGVHTGVHEAPGAGREVTVSKEIIPNRAFAAVLAESGLSHKRLARLVGEASRARGKRELRTDHVAVSRWLDGGQPQAEAAECIAAVLSHTLKRAITPASLGFTNAGRRGAEAPTVEGDVSYPSDADSATAGLRSVATADLENEAAERLQAWDRHAAPGVISGYLFGDVDAPATSDIDDEPVDATKIRRTTASLMELDFQVGGGHTRQLLLFYFRNQVLPLFATLPVVRREGTC